MPSVEVDLDYYITRRLRKRYTYTQLQDLLFEFGLELEEEYDKLVICPVTGESIIKKMIKVDAPSNRYDLLCGEGISKALKTYLGESEAVEYKRVTSAKDEGVKLIVSERAVKCRPYIVGAILKNVKFSNESYRSFIDVQEKLHFGLGRDRSLASMGTHDYDKIAKGPIYFNAELPEKIKYCPLFRNKAMTGVEIAQDIMTNDPRLKRYMGMIKDLPYYPVIVDSRNEVLTMPPVINSEYSKVSVETKNLFIDCTGFDKHKIESFLEVFCCTFSEYCEEPFTIHSVEVIYPDKTIITPEISYWNIKVSIEGVRSFVGVNLTPEETIACLLKAGLKSAISDDKKDIIVCVPPDRRDIIGEDDIFEDIAIMYGYSKIIPQQLQVQKVGSQQPLSLMSDRIRTQLAISGFTEVLTFTLVSREENSTFLRKKYVKAVEVSNPKALEYETLRTSMAPSMLKTISCNQSHSLPIKLFEISDVVIPVPITVNPCQAMNCKHLCALIAGKTPHFEIIHGLVDWLMDMLGIMKGDDGYSIIGESNDMYMDHRSASILYKKKNIGAFGVVHPEVLDNFGISLPCTLLEIDVEDITRDLYPV